MGIVNFCPLELPLLGHTVLCRLPWPASSLASYQALQKNLMSATAPGKIKQTLRIRIKTKLKSPPNPQKVKETY